MRAGHIASSNVRPAWLRSLALGVPVDALADLGLHEGQFANPDTPIPASVTYAHVEAVAQHTDIAGFLIDTAASHRLSSLGAVGLAAKTARTVQQALQCHHRYQHLTNRTARYGSRLQDGALILEEERYGAWRPGSAWVSDYAMLIAVTLLRQICGTVPIRQMRARSQGDADYRNAIAAWLQAPVQDGCGRASLHFDASFADLSLETADEELAAYFERTLGAAHPPEPHVVEQVRSIVKRDLLHGPIQALAVARELAMSHRTLLRRLREAGWTFAGLKADTQRRLAEAYLTEPQHPLSEVAYLLGFREQASFHRAFKRWTGKTPASWREASQSRS